MVVSAFAVTAVRFGVMLVMGCTTKEDLTKVGACVMMGPIGLAIAMVVSLFINSGPLDMPISIVGF